MDLGFIGEGGFAGPRVSEDLAYLAQRSGVGASWLAVRWLIAAGGELAATDVPGDGVWPLVDRIDLCPSHNTIPMVCAQYFTLRPELAESLRAQLGHEEDPVAARVELCPVYQIDNEHYRALWSWAAEHLPWELRVGFTDSADADVLAVATTRLAQSEDRDDRLASAALELLAHARLKELDRMVVVDGKAAAHVDLIGGESERLPSEFSPDEFPVAPDLDAAQAQVLAKELALGKDAYKAERFEEALVRFDAVVTVVPFMAEGLYRLGMARNRLGQHRQALADLGLALRALDVEDRGLLSQIYAERARAHRELGEVAAAQLAASRGLTEVREVLAPDQSLEP